MKPPNPFDYRIDYTEIGRAIVREVSAGGTFSRADLTQCLPPSLGNMGWDAQKELVEKLADLLCGAGVLVRGDYRYWLAEPKPPDTK